MIMHHLKMGQTNQEMVVLRIRRASTKLKGICNMDESGLIIDVVILDRYFAANNIGVPKFSVSYSALKVVYASFLFQVA